MHDYLFLIVGLFVGTLGTLIGAGGGFLLTPLLLFLFPDLAPNNLTALTLLTVFANSTSGSAGYAFRKQVHWPSVMYFTVAALPGVLFGVYLNSHLHRSSYQLFFAVFMFCMGLFLFIRSFKKSHIESTATVLWNLKNKIIGSIISFFVGILSSLLGIGGGIVHVPLLAEYMKYPLHLAAGTSHAILACTSMLAVADHFYRGDYHPLFGFVPYLVIGLVCGAQLGAWLSKRTPRQLILRLLSLALILVAFRLFLK